MPLKPRDPLLAAARFIVIFLMGVMAFVTAVMLIALPAILVFHSRVAAEMVANGAPVEAAWALAFVLALIAGATALGFLFFRNLYRIIGSVGEGDPFVPVNADRLRGMGWIVVAVYAGAIPLGAALHWLESVTEKTHSEGSLDLSGVLLALILFILARVFREGARMREELEGTV